jgi:hypothetical protein
VWQLAKILCCHRQHLVNLCESGAIKVAIDIRGKGSSRSTIRVPRAAVLEFLESRQVIVLPSPQPKSRDKLGRRADKHARKH